jgi:formamidopyrimidine-DNA glycosylase
MPELPEVEVTRRMIAPAMVDRTIASVFCTPQSYFFITPPRTLKRRLEGRRVTSLERAGKYLLATLDDNSRLLLHLGMTGQLFVQGASSLRLLSATARASLTPEQQAGFKPDAHTHLRISFSDDGPEVWFRDVRKFGKVEWLDAGAECARLACLGPDALKADGAHLYTVSRGRKVAAKALLLDQKVLAGVGNIYADEALFLSGIRPTRRAERLTRQDCARIADNIRKVMQRSIETGGSSISDYVNPYGSDGGYQDERKVYGLAGEPCRVCGTAIKRVVVGQRGTHYCPRCQK